MIRFNHIAALSIGVAASALSVPAMAQDATVAPPPVSAPAPAAAPAPVTPPPVVRTIQDTVAPQAQADAAKETPKAAAVAKPKAAPKVAAKAAPVAAPIAAATAPVEEPVTTLPITGDETLVPAAEGDIAAPAEPVAAAPAAAVPAESANSFGASENDWMYWAGGLAALLGLAGASAALSNRRNRRLHSNEHFSDEGHIIVESHEAPSFTARPAFAPAPRADAQFAPPASSGYASGSRSESGVWSPGYFESMVDDGPSEVNPFLTRKNRLRRARFLDRQAAANEPIFDWRGTREIQFASQARTAPEPELVH